MSDPNTQVAQPSENDQFYKLLQDEKITAFNTARANTDTVDLSGCTFRGLDLRGANVAEVNFTGAYFRGADLRGIDFRSAKLEGASLAEAKISGCYFPASLPAEEIRLSQEKGTRLRNS